MGWPWVWPPQHQVPLPKDIQLQWQRRAPLQRGCAHQDILGGKKCVCHDEPAMVKSGNDGKEAQNITKRIVSNIAICGLDTSTIAISINS